MLAGLAIGLLNGLLVIYVAASPIIVTLGTLFAVTALVTTASGGYPIGPLSTSFARVGSSSLFHIPSLVFYAVGIAVLVHILLEYTTIGTRLRSIGGNRDAAISLGLPVRTLTIGVYVLSGCLAAFAGRQASRNSRRRLVLRLEPRTRRDRGRDRGWRKRLWCGRFRNRHGGGCLVAVAAVYSPCTAPLQRLDAAVRRGSRDDWCRERRPVEAAPDVPGFIRVRPQPETVKTSTTSDLSEAVAHGSSGISAEK